MAHIKSKCLAVRQRKNFTLLVDNSAPLSVYTIKNNNKGTEISSADYPIRHKREVKMYDLRVRGVTAKKMNYNI